MKLKKTGTTIHKRLITYKTLFITTLAVIPLTIVSVWLFGLGQHRTLFQNSILSTSILSAAFFMFLTIGLYKGIKLKDDLGKIIEPETIDKMTKNLEGIDFPDEFPDLDDGIGGILIGILIWFFIAILLVLFITILGGFFWVMILAFVAMLYWIFFRAIRLVFKNSNKCKGDLPASVLYGLGYTILYNFWIYLIILSTHYLSK